MNWGKILWGAFRILFGVFGAPFVFAFFAALAGAVIFTVSFLVVLRRPPWAISAEQLEELRPRYKYHDLFRWILYDIKRRHVTITDFVEYGLTVFVGRQGAGKSIAMVEYLQRMRKRYPKCLIVTNFGYDDADMRIKDWRDFLELRNGEDGIIFAIDEIQSEFSSIAWRDFPDNLLQEICQQRKQRVKVVATAQYFMRVAKPLREQSKSVIACSTFAGRLTRTREYDAVEYAIAMETGLTGRKHLRSFGQRSFVQSNDLRASYDTYEKIERMSKAVFSERPSA